MKVTGHLYSVLTVRMSGAIALPSLYACMASTGKTEPFLLENLASAMEQIP
jgi:hypothetical protein